MNNIYIISRYSPVKETIAKVILAFSIISLANFFDEPKATLIFLCSLLVACFIYKSFVSRLNSVYTYFSGKGFFLTPEKFIAKEESKIKIIKRFWGGILAVDGEYDAVVYETFLSKRKINELLVYLRANGFKVIDH